LVEKLSHFDQAGNASMVDVSGKPSTRRTATASAFVELSEDVLAALPANPKGNPLEVARFAGIQAAKRTADLIPLCHPLPLTHVQVEFALDESASAVHCTVQAETLGRTGVEMEALTAVQVGLLTIYDMVKAIDRGMVMGDIRVLEKHGGKSGDWVSP
jgi:cyclic pyranopterin monophosphate synthase